MTNAVQFTTFASNECIGGEATTNSINNQLVPVNV